MILSGADRGYPSAYVVAVVFICIVIYFVKGWVLSKLFECTKGYGTTIENNDSIENEKGFSDRESNSDLIG